MKYIIELEDVPFSKKDGDFLYRVKGFNSLVFDMNGLQKLERYDKSAIIHEAYQRGYEDGFREGRTRKDLADALEDDLK